MLQSLTATKVSKVLVVRMCVGVGGDTQEPDSWHLSLDDQQHLSEVSVTKNLLERHSCQEIN